MSGHPADPTKAGLATDKIGIRQIYTRSPLAKRPVERAATTCRGQLLSELRLAGTATIVDASELLKSFLFPLTWEVRRSRRRVELGLPYPRASLLKPPLKQ